MPSNIRGHNCWPSDCYPSFKRVRVGSSEFITLLGVTRVPLMPGQDYKWLSDKKWRAHNDAIFRGK